MADFLQVKATNTADGPRIFNSIPQVTLGPGESTNGSVTIAASELESMRLYGQFDIDDGAGSSEPGPLDQSVEKLTAYLETVDDADAVQKLLDAEVAGKSRQGAVAALEARRDALLV